ncbi:MAG: carbon-nitrogen family hydrolase [Acidobacteria bacterium]|nr:carbon-nitrogen family hydrolase [Acidobacteriota bacterium]
MRVYACQTDIVWEDKAANHARVRALFERADFQAGSLVVLPEMFATGFSMRPAVTSDSAERATQTFLAETARAFGVYLLAGLAVDGKDGKGRNEAHTYSPQGELVSRYGKLQPFTLGGEMANYDAGESLVTFDLQGFSVASFICYDLRFPELFRAATRRGANLMIVIASWPGTRISHWMALLKARAIENQVYVVGVNRCGSDPALSYPGRTQMIDPSGEILADAGGQENIISAELRLEHLTEYRAKLPFLADMRSDFFPSVS